MSVSASVSAPFVNITLTLSLSLSLSLYICLRDDIHSYLGSHQEQTIWNFFSVAMDCLYTLTQSSNHQAISNDCIDKSFNQSVSEPFYKIFSSLRHRIKINSKNPINQRTSYKSPPQIYKIHQHTTSIVLPHRKRHCREDVHVVAL